MILLQLSAGRGPLECCIAVHRALETLCREAESEGISCQLIEAVSAGKKAGYKSVLLQLGAADTTLAKAFACRWEGTSLWICPSHLRPGHKRKNWYFNCRMFEIPERTFDSEIVYQTCRSSGTGGQHVNTTDSAVRATHTATGISVRAESERSQHANKRLARALLFHKLETLQQQEADQQEQNRWQQHKQLQRGNPVRTFKGEKFIPMG